jgi:hypothetical protein
MPYVSELILRNISSIKSYWLADLQNCGWIQLFLGKRRPHQIRSRLSMAVTIHSLRIQGIRPACSLRLFASFVKYCEQITTGTKRWEQPVQPVGGTKEHWLLESQLDSVTFQSTAVCIGIKWLLMADHNARQMSSIHLNDCICVS